ncbi:MAG: methyltransferase domain-containing protein [Actinomycetota bacterium]|nr:methyltransferase domain-containing protein [Actinomycetota bacterium]
MTKPQAASDLAAVKQAQQKVWSEGDYGIVAPLLQLVAEELVEVVDVMPGDRVLDVACGSGNVAVAAARRFTEVVGVDFVPELLARGRRRAAAEGLEIQFTEGDAEALPLEDESFDVVLSTFGSMFAPDQRKAAAELLRVCRPGGRIGMANWTPEGFAGQLFMITGKHAPPPVKLDPPVLWGTEEHVRELFGDGISSLNVTERVCYTRFYSFDHWLDHYRTFFGPMKMAFARVGEAGEEALTSDLRELVKRFNEGGERGTKIRAAYLEVVATRA